MICSFCLNSIVGPKMVIVACNGGPSICEDCANLVMKALVNRRQEKIIDAIITAIRNFGDSDHKEIMLSILHNKMIADAWLPKIREEFARL